MLATKRELRYTVSRMKQRNLPVFHLKSGAKKTMSSEFIWETFDSLFKTVHRQAGRVEELEARIVDLERRLNERAAEQAQTQQPYEMPAERAA